MPAFGDRTHIRQLSRRLLLAPNGISVTELSDASFTTLGTTVSLGGGPGAESYEELVRGIARSLDGALR